MADNVDVTPGSGATIATDEVSSRHFQLVKPAFGADGAATLVATDAGLPTHSSYKELSGSAAANATDLFSADIAGYRWVTVQITGSFSGTTAAFQQSNDGTTWVSALLRDISSISSATTTSASSTGHWAGPVAARYFRVRTSSYTSGTISALAYFTSQPPPSPSASVRVDGADINATVRVSGQNSPGDASSVFTSASVPTFSAAALYNGSNYDRARSLGVTGIQGVTPTPGTSGGWTVASYTALNATKQAVKASAGTLGGYLIHNPSAAVAYVQVFNVASASVTVGTTTPTYTIPVAAGAGAHLELTCGINHSTAITIAATTTATGSTDPATALVATILYK